MIKGLSTTKIALKLKVEKTTISTYKRRIYEKTKSSNIIEIAKILDIK
jgi:DNA-binding NarL/FixJ family response regulator